MKFTKEDRNIIDSYKRTIFDLVKILRAKPFAFDKIVFILSKTLGSNVNFTVAKI